MPTYVYACSDCGERLEVVQRFSDDPLTVCPSCQGALRKVIMPVGVVFKGSGFYKTDSRGSGSSGSGSVAKDSTAKDSGKDSGSKESSAKDSSSSSAATPAKESSSSSSSSPSSSSEKVA